MSRRIQQDEKEFRDIVVRRRIRRDLMEWLKNGVLPLPKSGGKIVVSIPYIEIPKLSYAPPQSDADDSSDGDEGEGMGPAEGVAIAPGTNPGDTLGPVTPDGPGQPGDGDGEDGEKSAGEGKGEDGIDIELSEEEFLEILIEELELPRIEPKGEKAVLSEEHKYTGISTAGPDSLLHKKRTLKEAMKRAIAEGIYVPKRPILIPTRRDRRYRSQRTVTKPNNNALVIYGMDVSGSMGNEERRIVRWACYLISLWLRSNYDGLEEEWVIHDGAADRVDRETFFATQRAGGTVLSTAHTEFVDIFEDYKPSEWNIYVVYFGDGFNFGNDNDVCRDIIQDQILDNVNMYAHAEVNAYRPWALYEQADVEQAGFSPQGNFGEMLLDNFEADERVVYTAMKTMEDVPDAIQDLFWDGK